MTNGIKWSKIKGNEHTLSKWNLAYDLMSIEEFFSDMLAQGWCPVSTNHGFQYTFVPCEPGEFICRTAITVTKNGWFDKNKAADLVELLTANGATLIPQKNMLGSQMGIIVLRPASLGSFEIDSDLDSKIAEYKSRKKYNESYALVFVAIGLCYLPIFVDSELPGLVALVVVWLALAYFYYRPVSRYRQIIKNLEANRAVTEV